MHNIKESNKRRGNKKEQKNSCHSHDSECHEITDDGGQQQIDS